MSGNNTARLDFVSARVDGQMFESSVRMSGNGTNANYVSWIGEKGCEISTIAIQVDTNRNLYVKMNSYSAVEIRVYGTFALNITELDSEPSGADITLQKLVTKSDINISNVFDDTNQTIDVTALEQYGYGTYELYGQGNDGHGIVRVHIWKVISGATVYTWEKIYSANQPTAWCGGNITYVVSTISCDASCMNYCDMIKKLSI